MIDDLIIDWTIDDRRIDSLANHRSIKEARA
jgi:hypothetical protein